MERIIRVSSKSPLGLLLPITVKLTLTITIHIIINQSVVIF